MSPRAEDGYPVIYAKPGASAEDVGHEATHIAQRADPTNPRMQENIRVLSRANLQAWDKTDARSAATCMCASSRSRSTRLPRAGRGR